MKPLPLYRLRFSDDYSGSFYRLAGLAISPTIIPFEDSMIIELQRPTLNNITLLKACLMLSREGAFIRGTKLTRGEGINQSWLKRKRT